MPTISTQSGVVMVLGLMIAVLVFVVVLAYLASRYRQNLRIDLDARLFRLKVSVNPLPKQEQESLPNTER
jgi:flagellar biogenesis protein FliO